MCACRKIDVRILAATARDLASEVQTGRFREDLYFRLNVIHILIPPLRRRRMDIPLLCRHFLEKVRKEMGIEIKRVMPEVMELFDCYGWPGNVRELENIIHRGAVIAEDQAIRVEHLPQYMKDKRTPAKGLDDFQGLSLKQAQESMEERIILKALNETGGNRLQASKLLEISYPSLLSKIKKYAISEPFAK